MPKTEAIQTLCLHALVTLPESLAKRETVLRATLELLPPNTALTTNVREMFVLLQRHQLLQAELPGLFPQHAK